MSAMNTHMMDAIHNSDSAESSGATDMASGLRELMDATAACRKTAAQARKTLSGMEPELRGLRLMVINGAL